MVDGIFGQRSADGPMAGVGLKIAQRFHHEEGLTIAQEERGRAFDIKVGAGDIPYLRSSERQFRAVAGLRGRGLAAPANQQAHR